jgi:predicted transcriptional regulator
MKREMEVVKQLLLLIEENEDDRKELKIPININRDTAAYHLKILDQAGYTKSNVHYASNEPLWITSSLTWEGHEFLSALKNDKAVEIAEKKSGEKGSKLSDLPFEVMKQLVIASSKQLLGL